MCRVFPDRGAETCKRRRLGKRVDARLLLTLLLLVLALPSCNYLLLRPSASTCLCPAPVWTNVLVNLSNVLQPHFRRLTSPPADPADSNRSQVFVQVFATPKIDLANLSNWSQLGSLSDSSKTEKHLAERLELLREQEHCLQLEVFRLQSFGMETTTSTTTTTTSTSSRAARKSDARHVSIFDTFLDLVDQLEPPVPPADLETSSSRADAVEPALNFSAAVTYLLKPEEGDLRNVYNSLAYLSQNFCNHFEMGMLYPILLFSDGCIDRHTKILLRSVAPHCRLHFESVSQSFHEMPTFPTEGFPHSFYTQDPRFRDLGYGQMIRWNVRTLFEHPRILKLDLVMRLDTDSAILTPMTFDPFKAMYTAVPKKRYAYYCSSFEGRDFRHGLHNFVAKYMQEADVVSPWAKFDPGEDEPVIMPYNNIEVVDVKWWRSGPLQHFVETVDRSLGIWQYRWGDAPIRGMAISLFLREDELLHLQDFEYSHPWGSRLEPLKFEHVNASVEDSRQRRFMGMCTLQFGMRPGSKNEFGVYHFFRPEFCKDERKELREFYDKADQALACMMKGMVD